MFLKNPTRWECWEKVHFWNLRSYIFRHFWILLTKTNQKASKKDFMFHQNVKYFNLKHYFLPIKEKWSETLLHDAYWLGDATSARSTGLVHSGREDILWKRTRFNKVVKSFGVPVAVKQRAWKACTTTWRRKYWNASGNGRAGSPDLLSHKGYKG